MMREAPLEGTDKLQQQIKEMCDKFKRDPKQYMEYLRFAGQFYQSSSPFYVGWAWHLPDALCRLSRGIRWPIRGYWA